jgi:hypothetical protein
LGLNIIHPNHPRSDAVYIAKLNVKAEEVSNQGRNLIAEMARDVKRRIDIESRRFEEIAAKKRNP